MRIFCMIFALAMASLLQTAISLFSRKYVKVPGINLDEDVKKTTISQAVNRKLTCATLCTKVANCTAFVYRSNKECTYVNERPSVLNISDSSEDQYMVLEAYRKPIIGLTRGKPAYFSRAENRPNVGYPYALNDGVYNLYHYKEPYCTHAINHDVRPWVKIDMETESTVVYGKILPRHDETPLHASNISIHVGDISDPLRLMENHLCYHYPGALPLATIHEFECIEQVRGRYVYISSSYHELDLVICEFELFGWH